MLARFVDVTPFFRQPATVENLIKSERGKKRKEGKKARKRRSFYPNKIAADCAEANVKDGLDVAG